jgi:TolB-like protein
MSEPRGYQRFFAELKRRHVFRVMAMYGAVGFIILQSVDLLIPALLLPDWTYRLIALILLIGFPIAIVLAWSFDVTPEGGLQRTRRASDDEISNITSASAFRRWPMGLAALAGTVMLGLGGWWVLSRAGTAAGSRDYSSIAVLPFANLTGDEQAEYLGDGLAEELRNALVRIEGLKVPSMTSAAAFKGSGTDIRTIGDSLDVALVLEGSVRSSGDQLRITAQLIDAANGFHVWSDTYDRPVGNLLDLQEDLTERIVEALSGELDGTEAVSIAQSGTDEAAAYDYYLQGRHFWNKRTPEDMRVAIGLFEKAIEVDSTYAPAYAAIADAYVVPTGWGDDPGRALDQAERYGQLALDLDPALAEAHTALAFTYMMRDLDFRRAERGFARAIELDRDYATAHQWFAELLSAMDRREEAIEEVRRAEELDPTPIIRWNVARILYFAGRYEEAIAKVGGVEGFDPESDRERDLWVLALSLYALGDFNQIADLLEELGPAPGTPPGSAEQMRQFADTFRTSREEEARRLVAAWFDGALADEQAPAVPILPFSALAWVRVEPDSALARLEQMAVDPDVIGARIGWFNILADSSFDPLRDDPRFQELNARFGL